MLPLTVITGILLGCSVSITIGLGVVVFLFALNMGEHPQIQAEFPTLVVSVVLFAIMTVVCGLSFIALIRRHAWRWSRSCDSAELGTRRRASSRPAHALPRSSRRNDARFLDAPKHDELIALVAIALRSTPHVRSAGLILKIHWE